MTSDTFSGVRSRYDDFVALHISQADYVHWVMASIFSMAIRTSPSARMLISGHNTVDWAQDSVTEAALLNSPVFDNEYGFGGNGDYVEDLSGFPDEWKTAFDIPGRSGGGCIPDGPFAGLNASMGPGNHTDYNPRCVRRDFSIWLMARALHTDTIAFVMAADTYVDLEHRTEGLDLGIAAASVHGGGHLGIGGVLGDMANTWSSTVDPIFWLHHSAIDRLWDVWQRNDWPKRKGDIGGPDTQWAYPYDYFGEKPYKNITLDFVMNFGSIGGMLNIQEVMDVQASLCYKYS
ncbi:Di-copper centre-containing protein [Annulohypoxylon maeteangense]|uniref:Di-copper centre-containing protein n=1 Tax=Annulohypoxylon maeteangense TaxID=1927788 RepID=UPI002008E279|nr:Di-copper centre-containing protein [Annulohypoxylon maeteangense]KAI0885542.1 Di-copper centre-containing protein [Annulohypoxylon maeteangense]